MHPMLCHLLRSWATIGLAMVLMAAFAALTGCGGGSVDDDPRVGVAPPNCAASGVCQ